MTEKERLLQTLFQKNKDREHLNIKFFRGTSDDIAPEDICREANSALFQMELGLARTRPDFDDAEGQIIDVEEIYGG